MHTTDGCRRRKARSSSPCRLQKCSSLGSHPPTDVSGFGSSRAVRKIVCTRRKFFHADFMLSLNIAFFRRCCYFSTPVLFTLCLPMMSSTRCACLPCLDKLLIPKHHLRSLPFCMPMRPCRHYQPYRPVTRTLASSSTVPRFLARPVLTFHLRTPLPTAPTEHVRPVLIAGVGPPSPLRLRHSTPMCLGGGAAFVP